MQKNYSCVHGLPYRSIPIYRPTIGLVYTDVPTHGTVGYINRLVFTTHTNPLLDRYISSGTLWHDEPWLCAFYICFSRSIFIIIHVILGKNTCNIQVVI